MQRIIYFYKRLLDKNSPYEQVTTVLGRKKTSCITMSTTSSKSQFDFEKKWTNWTNKLQNGVCMEDHFFFLSINAFLQLF